MYRKSCWWVSGLFQRSHRENWQISLNVYQVFHFVIQKFSRLFVKWELGSWSHHSVRCATIVFETSLEWRKKIKITRRKIGKIRRLWRNVREVYRRALSCYKIIRFMLLSIWQINVRGVLESLCTEDNLLLRQVLNARCAFHQQLWLFQARNHDKSLCLCCSKYKWTSKCVHV